MYPTAARHLVFDVWVRSKVIVACDMNYVSRLYDVPSKTHPALDVSFSH